MRNFVYIFFFSIVSYTFAQNQANIWCFGTSAMIDFNTGLPVDISPSAINAGEGCASIADNNGNLLFYTNGISVWDKNHTVMPNGAGLLGGISSTQSTLIAPLIGEPSQYYLFALDHLSSSGRFSYSIVDMALPPQGDVIPTRKNIVLTDAATEKLTSIPHADKLSYWAIIQKQHENTFYSYHVTCNGINTSPVVSPVLTFTSTVQWGGAGGYLKASKDGKMLVAAYNSRSIVVAYDFNNNSGVVSNPRIIKDGLISPYGVEFSENDSLFYVSDNRSIFQYQRYATNIEATKSQVYRIPASTSGAPSYIGALQLATDKKIYFPELQNKNFLGRINDPNTIGIPSVTANAITFGSGAISRFGLPNIFTAYINGGFYNYIDTLVMCAGDLLQIGPANSLGSTYTWSPVNNISNPTIANPIVFPINSTTYTLTMQNSCGDNAYLQVHVKVNPLRKLAFTANRLTGCTPATIQFTDSTQDNFLKRVWVFGDTKPADSLKNPIHLYDQPGKYSVKLMITDNNGCTDSLVKSDYISVYPTPTANFTFTPDIVSIYDSEVNFFDNSITTNRINTWQWSFGDDTASSSNQNPIYRFKNIKNYVVSLEITDSNGCKDVVSKEIQITAERSLFIPKAFTPNNDEINDSFCLKGWGINYYQLAIFDRWGNNVYLSNNINEGWDGTVDEKPAISDIYIYSVYVVFLDEFSYTKTGTLSLIR